MEPRLPIVSRVSNGLLSPLPESAEERLAGRAVTPCLACLGTGTWDGRYDLARHRHTGNPTRSAAGAGAYFRGARAGGVSPMSGARLASAALTNSHPNRSPFDGAKVAGTVCPTAVAAPSTGPGPDTVTDGLSMAWTQADAFAWLGRETRRRRGKPAHGRGCPAVLHQGSRNRRRGASNWGATARFRPGWGWWRDAGANMGMRVNPGHGGSEAVTGRYCFVEAHSGHAPSNAMATASDPGSSLLTTIGIRRAMTR